MSEGEASDARTEDGDARRKSAAHDEEASERSGYVRWVDSEALWGSG